MSVKTRNDRDLDENKSSCTLQEADGLAHGTWRGVTDHQGTQAPGQPVQAGQQVE